MSLKSIRESYSKLLTTFQNAGVKFSESQKRDIDTFVLALESKMQKQREQAVRHTRKIVEAKMEKQFREAFEGVMQAVSENSSLAAKIQDHILKIEESKKMAEKVNDYLDLYVESVLPKKTILDYDRLRKLEKLHESIKDALVVDEDAVQDKIEKLEELYKAKKSSCETEVAKLRVKLNESMKKTQKFKREIESFKAKKLLESKLEALPSFEAREMRKIFAESTEDEILEKFEKELDEVREKAEKIEKRDEKTVKTEVEKILEADVEEDDVLKNRNHNGHKSVEEDDVLKNRNHNGHKPVEEDEQFETMEEVEFDEDGDVRLDSSDVIDESLMNMWCRQSIETK